MTFRLPVLMLLVAAGFTLFAQGQVPFIQQPLQPSAVAPGSPAFTLTVRGSAFVHGALVMWNDQPLSTTFIGITELNATVPRTNVADAGTAKINVWNTPNSRSNDAYLAITSRTRARFEQILRSTGDQAAQLVAADFNRDGNLDVAFVGLSGVIEVLLNKGDGNFTAPVDYAITPGFNGGLATADFNRDGKMDLAATGGVQPSLVAVLLGNGDGTFQPSLNFPVASFPQALTVGDFDRDGKLDILTLCLADELSHGALSLLRGRGDGTFTLHHDSPAVNNPISMTIDDFNRDGDLDVAIVGGSSPDATIFLGNGNGTFQSGLAYPLADSGSFITSADLNKDGFSDLVVTAVDVPVNGVSVLLNQGDGSFGPAVLYDTPPFSNPVSVLVADVDADGKEDIVTADEYDALAPGQISILEGNGDGSFQPHQDRNVAGYAPRGIIAGDVNSDGKPDLVVSYIQDFKLSTLRAK